MSAVCRVDGCGHPRTYREWCQAHYRRWQKTGDVQADVAVRLHKYSHGQMCSIEGCTDPVRARGWCRPHYRHWRRHGDVNAPKQGDTVVCVESGCSTEAPAVSGRCQSCYASRKRRLQHMALVLSAGGECRDCGGKFAPAAYEFHHRDPEAKEAKVANLAAGNLDAAIEEAKKCDLLCGTCHNLRHDPYPRSRVA